MALLLRDIVGLSYTEIADSLEVTLATVKWRIWKAREDVQLALAREGIEVYEEREVPAVAPSRRAGARRGHARSAGLPRCLVPRLQAELEPRGEHLGQARVPHLALRALDVVLDAAEARVLRVEVEQEIRRARVAVPRLTDRARIEERPDAAELELRAVRRDAACELVVGLDDLQRDVAVPDEHERRVGELERGQAPPSSLRTYSQTGSRAEPW